VNQIARDVAALKYPDDLCHSERIGEPMYTPVQILERYVERNQGMMEFRCKCEVPKEPDEPKPTDERQAGLFDGED
jgi:hypothetical protein